jgi:hypothetical protein
MAVPFHTPVAIVPVAVILACVKCSFAAKFPRESWSMSPSATAPVEPLTEVTGAVCQEQLLSPSSLKNFVPPPSPCR